MPIAAQSRSYPAKDLNTSQRKKLALAAVRKDQPLSALAKGHQVSRKFVYQQQDKALEAINKEFAPPETDREKVLFYLPVTFSWLCQFILCLVLHCRANHRGIQKLLGDAFDHHISLGGIHNMVDAAKTKAKIINDAQDLTNVTLAAKDEMFHYNKPILTGIDIRSLYCYLLSSEEHRDFDTWGTHMLDLKEQGYNPERLFSDDADPLRSAHKYVFPTTPCDIDNFHIIKEMMDMRRYFRNCLKSAITKRKTLHDKVKYNLLDKNNVPYDERYALASSEELQMKYLSTSIDILVGWMQHDVLNMPGLEPTARYELFDFILNELKQLALNHPHRIKSVCTTLTNQKPYLLAFTDVLNDKFQEIADSYVYPIEKIWAMCALQRCQHSGITYGFRSLPLQEYFGSDFDEVEDAVIEALNTTERTSSMIENLHSRLRPYFYLRREIGYGYLDLLRFYINHTPFLRSAREERKGKTPAQLLTGKDHPHWLEMLGFQRFRKAA